MDENTQVTSVKVKSLLHSKTFWLAIAQAVGAVAIVVFTELDMLGYAALVKSLVDTRLRMMSDDVVRL